jgi:putative transposase
MKKSRFNEEQIIGVLKEAEAGIKPAELCRKHGLSEQTFYRWKAKYGGMDVSDAKRLKALEDENRRLKLMVANLSLDNEVLRAVNAKKW